MLTSVVLINILGFFESKRIATVLMLSWTPVIAYGLIAILGLAPINAVYAPALLIIPAIFEMLISSAAAYLNMQNIQRELLESEVRKKQNEILKQAMRTISHDLANHFFVAEHCIEAVKKQNTHLDPKSQSRLNKVKKSLTQSTMLLNRVKCWIQVGDGKVKVHNEAVAITPLIKESIELFEERAKEKNIQISTKWDQECEQLKIWGDPVAVFNQVINNTLSNAIKFSYHNSAISIEVHQINDNILVTIKDSGIGIKKIDQLKFIQNGHIESTFGTGNEKGTGFGMSLMKTYMEAFDGSVTINSSTEEANRGTEIVLSFKFAGKNETSFIDDAFARAGIA